MITYDELTIRRRIVASFAVVVAAMVTMAAVAYTRLTNIEEQAAYIVSDALLGLTYSNQIRLASTGDHLALKTADRIGYTPDPIDYVYRPSVDVFFHSACRLWRGDIVGVLLTGMGRDGALGLKALRDRGHYTIARDQATSAVYGMPKAAAMIDAAVDILPADRIATKLMEVLMAKT